MKSAQLIYLSIPDFCNREIHYICDWVFGDLFGLQVVYTPHEKSSPYIAVNISEAPETLRLSASVFKLLDDYWLDKRSVDGLCVKAMHVPKELVSDGKSKIPMLAVAGQNMDEFGEVPIQRAANKTVLDVDLLGALFFLISRYEECVLTNKDKHDRFPAEASIIGSKELLQQAVGNQYIELLWQSMKICWPHLTRIQRQYRTLPSHDIDHPLYYWGKTHLSVIKTSVSDIVHRRNFYQSTSRIVNWVKYLQGKNLNDPYDRCDWLMTQSEKHGLRSAFYYIPVKTHSNDPSPPINEPLIQNQWKRIASRGHELGCHPGYDTYNSPQLLAECFQRAVKQLKQLGIDHTGVGGRQHVLRWSTPHTARYLDSAGFSYDSTLGYAEMAGFRCGVCYEFPMYDVRERNTLSLVQRPLVAMDVTVLNPRYMNMSIDDAHDVFVKLKKECQIYHGDYTLLWHNTELLTEAQRELYCSILAA